MYSYSPSTAPLPLSPVPIFGSPSFNFGSPIPPSSSSSTVAATNTFTFGASSLSLPRGINPKKEYEDSDAFLKRKSRRWIYTPVMGFGEILHPTKQERDEVRVREIAASFTTPPIVTPTILPTSVIPV